MHSRYLVIAPYWLAALVIAAVLMGCAMNIPASTNSSTATAKSVTLTVEGATSIRAATSTNFTAVLSDGKAASVQWSVNGEEGGDTSIGTIDSSGHFTAPNPLPATTTVTIEATQTAAPFLEASVT